MSKSVLYTLLQQENNISNIENRNYFSLHCIQMETQLIHANLHELYNALQTMSDEQGRQFAEVHVLHKNATIHLVTTMLATSKNDLFPGHNHLPTPVLMTRCFDYLPSASGWRVISTGG